MIEFNYVPRILAKKGKLVALTTGEGKVPQPVAQIGCQEILQQLVAKIPWGHNLILLNNSRSTYPVISPG